MQREKTYKPMILYVFITVLIIYLPIAWLCNKILIDDSIILNKYGEKYDVVFAGKEETYGASDSDLSIVGSFTLGSFFNTSRYYILKNKETGTHLVRCLSHNIVIPFFREDLNACNSTEEEQLTYRAESDEYINQFNQISDKYGVACDVIELSNAFDYKLDYVSKDDISNEIQDLDNKARLKYFRSHDYELEWGRSDFNYHYAVIVQINSYSKFVDLFKSIQSIDTIIPTSVIACRSTDIYNIITQNKGLYYNNTQSLLNNFGEASNEYFLSLNKDGSNLSEFIAEINNLPDSVVLSYEDHYRSEEEQSDKFSFVGCIFEEE